MWEWASIDWWLAFLPLAIASSITSYWWRNAVERGDVWMATLIDGLLDALNWAPIFYSGTTDDIRIAIVSVVGSMIGTNIAMRIWPKKKPPP